MTNETDPDVLAALEGDKDALERLVERVQPLVYRLALRFFGNPILAPTSRTVIPRHADCDPTALWLHSAV